MTWYRSDENNPDNARTVLVCDSISKIISMATYNESNDTYATMSLFELPDDYVVTHWTELPKPPKNT